MISKEFIDLCKKYGFGRIYFENIIKLRSRGYNQSKISNKTGISRTTINKYIALLRKMSKREIKIMYKQVMESE